MHINNKVNEMSLEGGWGGVLGSNFRRAKVTRFPRPMVIRGVTDSLPMNLLREAVESAHDGTQDGLYKLLD